MDSDFGIPRELSDLQKHRALYEPEIPPCLQGTTVRVEFGDATTAADASGSHTISRSFPHTYGHPLAHFLRATAQVLAAQIITEHPPFRVGIVFCGRQSPGGHNVIWGLHSALKIHNPKSILLGFLGGTDGLFAQKTLEITDDILSTYKNQGGYDLLGRTKDQIRTTEQVTAALNTCRALKLDGLVIIGGVTSNMDAAQLAEIFAEAKCPTKVVGVPVTLNGDLKNQFVETNVGFDTICKVLIISHMFWSLVMLRNDFYAYCGKTNVDYIDHLTIVGLMGDVGSIGCRLLRQNAMKFLIDDVYRNPGPLQFDGPGSDAKTVTLCVEDQDYMGRIKKLQGYLEKVRNIVKPGCPQDVLKAALSSMASVTEVLSVMSAPSFNSQTLI
ncbi:pyrophosphate--fructose 6-phosphate 1-phosphotransferase subunit alpha-like [Macadamia integrifolia]|uniref:pyrophosphate--fructose 6-phosphate 1-phosphotransferase subunit alpha-like n=1 Tax=Macadamia integrifolia TaxID=60698 RepID=UPI001C4EC982|nr:pyrophosphate--fructose 6-phosphate 1-phosphotransferase subunit alpha-like [Macadamia integrifolia]